MVQEKRRGGQVFIIVAMMLPVFILFMGLVIDLGWILLNKQKLQNGVDFVALAAASQTYDNHGQVESMAIEYALLNGIKISELKIIHPYQNKDNRVRIEAKRDIPLLFASITGMSQFTIRVSAAAEMGASGMYGLFDYLLMVAIDSGEFKISGGKNVFNGDVHINGSINVGGQDCVFNGALEVGSVKDIKDSTYIHALVNPAETLPLAVLDHLSFLQQATKVYTGNVSLGADELSGIIYVDGDVTISDSRFVAEATVVATGDIKISGSNVVYADSKLVAFYSAFGSIELTGSNSFFRGVWYAPNGNLKITGGGNTIAGALASNTFSSLSGTANTFDYDPAAKYAFQQPQPSYLIE